MNRLPSLARIASCAAATLLLPLAAASAAQLDWDALTQANGSQNNTFTVGNTQVNVVVASPTDGVFITTTDTSNISSPAITKDVEGGTNPVQNSLVIGGDFATRNGSITVTVSFRTLNGSQPQQVTGVNFDLYDIDLGSNSYVDQIRAVQGVLGSNTTIKPAQVTGSPGNNVTGNATTGFTITGTQTINNMGTTSNQANATINFGTQAITGFTFTYGDDATAPADPGRQVIAFHDINFTPVPEPGTASMIGLGGLLASFVFFRRRSQASVV